MLKTNLKDVYLTVIKYQEIKINHYEQAIINNIEYYLCYNK